MGHSPSPRPSLNVVAVVGVVCLACLVYAILAMGNPILGLFPTFVALAGYVAWRFLVAVEATADGLQRVAAVLEDEDH